MLSSSSLQKNNSTGLLLEVGPGGESHSETKGGKICVSSKQPPHTVHPRNDCTGLQGFWAELTSVKCEFLNSMGTSAREVLGHIQ